MNWQKLIQKRRAGDEWGNLIREKNVAQIIGLIKESQRGPKNETIAFLGYLSTSPDVRVRKAVASALDSFKFEDILQIILRLSQDPKAVVRQEMISTLARIKTPRSVSLLTQMSQDKSKIVRRSLARTLTRTKGISPQISLAGGLNLIQDQDELTSTIAYAALKKYRRTQAGVIASAVIRGVQDYHPTLFARGESLARNVGRLGPVLEESNLAVGDLTQRVQVLGLEPLAPPAPAFSRLVGQAQSLVRERIPRSIWGSLCVMIKGNERQEGYIHFISSKKDYRYLFYVAISPPLEIDGRNIIQDLPNALDQPGTRLAIALVSTNEECLEVGQDAPEDCGKGRVKMLVVPKEGTSAAICFSLRGLKAGRSALEILVYYRGSLVMRSEKFQVTILEEPGVVSPRESGSPSIATILADQHEDISNVAQQVKVPRIGSLLIEDYCEAEQLLFCLFLQDDQGLHLTTARVPKANVNQSIDLIHQQLLQVAKMVRGQSVTMPRNDGMKALSILRNAGISLWGGLFNDPKAELVRKQVISLSSLDSSEGIFQFVSDCMYLPWQLLYIRGDKEGEPEPDRFLGMKFQIEHVWSKGEGFKFWNPNKTREHMIAFINTTLPAQTLIQHKQIFVNDDIRSTEDDVITEFKREPNARPALYFYCHGEFVADHLDQSWIRLTQDSCKLTLDSLRTASVAPSGNQLVFSMAPLVFINACESARVGSSLYKSFVVHLMHDRHAGGFIGTETEMPAFFATDFAKQFWQEIRNPYKTVSSVMLDLRKQFWKDCYNPLGLLYSLFANGELGRDFT